jgi:hypothetical protein
MPGLREEKNLSSRLKELICLEEEKVGLKHKHDNCADGTGLELEAEKSPRCCFLELSLLGKLLAP